MMVARAQGTFARNLPTDPNPDLSNPSPAVYSARTPSEPFASASTSSVDIAAITGQAPVRSRPDDLEHPLRHAGAGRFWKPEEERRRRRILDRLPRLPARSAAAPSEERQPSIPAPRSPSLPALPLSIPPAPPSMPLPPTSPPSYIDAIQRPSNISSITLPAPAVSASGLNSGSSSWAANRPRRIARGLSNEERTAKARFHLERLQELEDARLAHVENDDASSTNGSNSPPTRHTSGSSKASYDLPSGLRASSELPRASTEAGGKSESSVPRARRDTSESTFQALASSVELPDREPAEIEGTERLELGEGTEANLANLANLAKVEGSQLASGSTTGTTPHGKGNELDADSKTYDIEFEPPLTGVIDLPFLGFSSGGHRKTESSVSEQQPTGASVRRDSESSTKLTRQSSVLAPELSPPMSVSSDDDGEESLFGPLATLKSRLSQQAGGRSSSSDFDRFRVNHLERAAARNRSTPQVAGSYAELDGHPRTSWQSYGPQTHRHSPSVESLGSPPPQFTLTPPLPENHVELPGIPMAPRPNMHRVSNRLSRISRSSGDSTPPGSASALHSPPPPPLQQRVSSVIAPMPPSFSIDIEPDIDPRTGRMYVPPPQQGRSMQWKNPPR